MIINHSSSVALASMGSVAQQLIGAWRQTMQDVSSSKQSMG
jgi:hypothetical protein